MKDVGSSRIPFLFPKNRKICQHPSIFLFAIIALFAGVMIPVIAMAGAIESGRVRIEDKDLLANVVQRLVVHDDSRLRPHSSELEGNVYTYTLDYIRFLGRVQTPAGYRNIFHVIYVRSEPYDIPSNTPPARGHHFYLSVLDGGEIEFFGTTDADIKDVSLSGGILESVDNTFDLKTEKGWDSFRKLRPIN